MVLDVLSDMFGGDEKSRPHQRHFPSSPTPPALDLGA